MSELTLQRRLERQVVRVQARIEAGLGDRWIPNVLAATLAAVMIQAGLARLDAYETGVELAGYSQALWLMTDGKMPTASLFGTDVHLLALSWSFILYPVALLALVFPAAKLLIVVQGIALSLAIFPLWRLARRVANLRVGRSVGSRRGLRPASCDPSARNRRFPPRGAGRTGPDRNGLLSGPRNVGSRTGSVSSSPSPAGRTWASPSPCGVSLPLVIASESVGIWTLGVGLIWSLGLLLVVQPISGPRRSLSPVRCYDSLAESVLGALRSPLVTLGELFAAENISLVVALLTPLIFLPLLSLRYLAPAFPLAGDLSHPDAPGRPSLRRAQRHAAGVHDDRRDLRLEPARKHGRRPRLLGRHACCSTLMAASVLLFVSTSPISPYNASWTPDRTDRAVDAALELLEPDDAVRASPSALAHLSDRPWLFAL